MKLLSTYFKRINNPFFFLNLHNFFSSLILDFLQRIFQEVMKRFRPEAIVCQCGADGLANDPLGTFNLTPKAYARCTAVIQSYKLPTLYLGGGGYHKANASRCFTTILAGLLGLQISSDIPEHEV